MLHIQFVTCQATAYLDEIFSNVSQILQGWWGDGDDESPHPMANMNYAYPRVRHNG